MNSLLRAIFYKSLSFFNFNGAVVLLYHSISDNAEFSTVVLDRFLRQMEYLKLKKFNVIKISELVDVLEKKARVPKKTICLTFDDGYEDNFLNAFPVLKENNFPAAIFVSTAYLGCEFENKRGLKAKILSPAQIKEMASSGLIEFGSHSHHHKKLTKLDQEEARQELLTSKITLEKILGQSVDLFSYPSGRYDQKTEALARQLFKIILTVEPGRIANQSLVWRLKRNSIDRYVSFGEFKGILKFGRW